MNSYYNVTALAPYTLAKAEDVNAQFTSVMVAFDKLPSPEEIAQGRIGYLTDTGSANAIVTAFSTAPTAYAAGLSLSLLVAEANTGATTINVNGLGARPALRPDGGALIAGDLTAGAMSVFKYDGSAFRLVGGGNVVENERALAQAFAASALLAPGTSATSSATRTVGIGSVTFPIQPGKLFTPGQFMVAAATGNVANQMTGLITFHDNVAGSITINVTSTLGSGTFSAWTLALSSSAVASYGTITTSGLASGGGSTGGTVNIGVAAAVKADMLAGTSLTVAATPKAIADMGVFLTLADAATVAWNTNSGISSILTLTTAVGSTRALAAPGNLKDGWSYTQVLIQGTGGNMTATFDAVWDFDQTPTFATVAGKYNVASGKYCQALGKIIASFRTSS